MKQIIMLLLLTSVSMTAYADTQYEIAYRKCVDKAGTMNNGVMAECSEAVSAIAKKAITTYYKKIQTKMADYDNKADLLSKLDTSQKAWIQYRNTHCALSEMIALHEPYCLMQLNSQRAEELKVLAE